MVDIAAGKYLFQLNRYIICADGGIICQKSRKPCTKVEDEADSKEFPPSCLLRRGRIPACFRGPSVKKHTDQSAHASAARQADPQNPERAACRPRDIPLCGQFLSCHKAEYKQKSYENEDRICNWLGQQSLLLHCGDSFLTHHFAFHTRTTRCSIISSEYYTTPSPARQILFS